MTPIDRAREAAAKATEKRWNQLDGNPLARRTDVYNAALDAFLAKLAEDGMVVVPRVATPEMIMAGIAERHGQPVPEAWSLATQNIYRAMIEAATSPPPPEGDGT